MKKWVLFSLFFLGFLLLAGCQEQKPTFTVEVKNLQGEVVYTDDFLYPEGTTKTFFEVIDEEVDLDYEMTTYGPMIKGVEGFYPKETGITWNYYISIQINDLESKVGISEIEFEEDVKISFVETTTLSAFDLNIDQWIESFIANNVNSYVNNTSVDHYVLAALKHLDLYGFEVGLDQLAYPTLELNTIGNQFKQAVINQVKGESLTDIETALLSSVPSNPYDAVTYMNALDVIYGNEPSPKRIETANFLMNHVPEYMDADYAGMALSGISSIQEDQSLQTYLKSMIDYIKDAQTSAGVVSYEQANSASTASAILGLYALKEDPTSAVYTTDNVNLIQALMTFKGQVGFKLALSDDTDNLMFSTPQAFAALVLYKIHRDFYTYSELPVLNLWNLSSNE